MHTKEHVFAPGDKAKDMVTGFEGTVVGVAFYLTGCTQYLITPECEKGKTSKKPNGHWFDEDRIELVQEEIIKPAKVQGKKPGADIPAPGGTREY